MKKKKVFIYIHQSILNGGVEKVFYNLFNNLPDNKYDVTILNYVAYLTDDLKSVKYKNQKRRMWFYYDEFSDNMIYRFIQRVHNKIMPLLIPIYLKFFKYDVAIAAQEGMYAKFVIKNIKADKKLLWIHNDMNLCRFTEKHFENAEAEKKCYMAFDNVVCVSEDVKKTMIDRFGCMGNLCVKYNPIDTDEIDEKLKESVDVKRNDNTLFVCVGRLVEQKGYDRLLEVCDKLNKEGYKYNVWVIGEGDSRNNLEEYKSRHNVTNVTFMGNKSNPFKYMKQADWLLCTSRHEGFNMVIHEAVYCGKPIITTLNAGATELLGNSEFGMVIDNNTDAIYSAMKKILEDKSVLEYYTEKVKERKTFVSLSDRVKNIENLF